MIVLGIETAGPSGSVALVRDGSPTLERSFASAGRLGSELGPTVQELLEEAGLGPDSPPDLVAVDTGPGSYTGLRIGLACAKGLAFAWSRPLIGISAIEALSVEGFEASQEEAEESRVLCALDASRGEVYAALYTRREGRLRLSFPGELTKAEALSKRVDQPAFVVGSAASAVAQALPHTTPLSHVTWPSARRIAALGRRNFLDGELIDPLQLFPTYYRPSEAEEQRRKRNMRGEGKSGRLKKGSGRSKKASGRNKKASGRSKKASGRNKQA